MVNNLLFWFNRYLLPSCLLLLAVCLVVVVVVVPLLEFKSRVSENRERRTSSMWLSRVRSLKLREGYGAMTCFLSKS